MSQGISRRENIPLDSPSRVSDTAPQNISQDHSVPRQISERSVNPEPWVAPPPVRSVPKPMLRRSARSTKGIPPAKYQD